MNPPEMNRMENAPPENDRKITPLKRAENISLTIWKWKMHAPENDRKITLENDRKINGITKRQN